MKEIVDITNITKIKFRRSGAHCGLGESEVGRSHDWNPGVLSCNAYAGRVPAPKEASLVDGTSNYPLQPIQANVMRPCHFCFSSLKDTAKRVRQTKTSM